MSGAALDLGAHVEPRDAALCRAIESGAARLGLLVTTHATLTRFVVRRPHTRGMVFDLTTAGLMDALAFVDAHDGTEA